MSSNGEYNQEFLRDLIVFFLLFAMLLGLAISGFFLVAIALSALL